MERIPFGINRLDTTLDGGVPRGSVVLLAGEAGAGAREFMHTAAVMNGVARRDEELFDLHYGQLGENAVLPDGVQYLSFTADRREFEREVELSMETALAHAGLEAVEFHSLADAYFRVSPVPREWYSGEETGVTLKQRHQKRRYLLDVLSDAMSDVAPGNLVIIDSLSDLVSAISKDLEWADIIYMIKGIRNATRRWGGLVLVHVDSETLTDLQRAQLVESCTGSLVFEWASGGSVLARTLVLQSFRGLLARIPEDDLVEFETELGDAGFTVSDVRKIR